MARSILATKVLRKLTSPAGPAAGSTGVAVDLTTLLVPRPVHLTALRVDDFLSLDFFLYNLKLRTGAAPAALRTNSAKPSFLVAQFQGQAFAEEAYWLTDSPATSDPPAVPPTKLAQAILAGPSRLAFRMPEAASELPLTLAQVLAACRTWPMSLDGLAAPLPPNFTGEPPVGGLDLVAVGSLAAATIKAVLTGTRFAEIGSGLAARGRLRRPGSAWRAVRCRCGTGMR